MLQNLKNKLKDNKGFSLVELIVVIAIMVILIAILVPQVSGYIQKANKASNESAAKSVYDAAVTYVADQAASNVQIKNTTVSFTSDPLKSQYLPNLGGNVQKAEAEIDTNGVVTKATYQGTSGGDTYTYPTASNS